MKKIILKNLNVIAGICAAIIMASIFTIIVCERLESGIYKDFIYGQAGDIEKIVVKNRFGELTINDELSMAYLMEAFKTLEKTKCSNGNMSSAYVYYKNRPIIYGEIFISGDSPDKACFWVNGDDGSKFEFKLKKPFPEGFKIMIDFINRLR